MHGSHGMGGPGGGPMGGPGGFHFGAPSTHVNAANIDATVSGNNASSPTYATTSVARSPQQVRTDTPSARAAIILAQISLIMGGLLLLSNFLGARIWHLGPIILDGGVLVFPVIYICGDILVEIYKKTVANKVEFTICILNLVAIVACWLVDHLPSLKDAGNVSLTAAFNLSRRVMFASVIGFMLSYLINNSVFQKIKNATPVKKQRRTFGRRALISSFFARIADTLAFNLIAFGGRTEINEMWSQIFWAFIVASILETILLPITKIITTNLNRKIRG